jgi:transglutaminase-like putative cysteine protease
MKYRIRHVTRYHYSEAVNLCRNEACLLVRKTEHQRCRSSVLQISPEATDIHERSDFFGNRRTHFAIQQPHDTLTVTAVSEVEVFPRVQLQKPDQSHPWEVVVEMQRTQRTPDIVAVMPYRYASPLVPLLPALADYARVSMTPGRPVLSATSDLMRRIYHDFSYDPASTTIATPLTEVLEKRRGVCQDFAHVAIGCLRSLGLAARYVSGYIETLPPPGQERLIGADASHAWFSVYLPGSGWVDYDPTNNHQPLEQHITVAWGRDFSDVSPLKGIALGGGKHQVVVSVDVARQTDIPLLLQQQQGLGPLS